jgi:phage-related protein
VPAPARTSPAQSARRPAASGPPALRLAEPPPAPVAAPTPQAVTPAPAPAPTLAAPQSPRAQAKREEGLFDIFVRGLVRQFAPDLEEIIRDGILGWLQNQIAAAISRLVNTLFAPIRAVTGVAATLTTLFQSLVEWMQEAAAKIAKGDCSSITEAAEKIEQVVSGVLSVVSDKIKELAKKVSDFFGGLWNRFGAPIWETLKAIGGEAWARIQALGQKLWDSTEKIREAGEDAWKWVKDRLGIGEGAEGHNGLLQWVKAKAEEAWKWLAPRIDPYKKQLAAIATTVLLLSPAGPILLAAGAVVGLMYGIRWIRQYLRSRADLIAQRGVLEGVIIPGLMQGIAAVTGALKGAAASVSTRLGDVVGAIGQFAGSLASSLLDFAKQFIEWIGEQFLALSKWATEKLNKLVEWVTTGMARLKAWLQPALDALHKVSEVVTDIVKIPVLVASAAWHKIPACLRDPFVNFLINQVLKRIPLFKQITEVLPAMWQKIKTTALSLLRKVFMEGKLKEAALDVLVLLLEALEVPLDLVKTVLTKGLDSIDLILDKPLEFLANMLGAVKLGIFQFGERILEHLLSGLQGWIFAAATKAGLTPPKELSFQAVFEFVLQVLDVTVDKVLERLEKRIGPEKTKVIRKVLTVMAKVWEWVSTLLNEGPAGVWKKLLGQLGDLWGSLLTTASGYITKTVTKIALEKVLALVAGGPIGVVINGIVAIWKALQTFAKYFKQILEIMNVVFDTIADIARGAIAGAANMVENLMDRSLPVILAFLANQIGLGDLSERIKVVLEEIRAKVAEAIDWLIDKALAIGGAVLGLIKAGIAKVTEWWKAGKKFMFGGEEHTLKFEGEGPAAELMVQSTPKVLADFLKERKQKKITEAQQKALDDIEEEKRTIDRIKKKTGGSFGKEDGDTIMKAFEKIADRLPKLGGGEVPRSEVKWAKTYPIKDPVGKKVTASPLSLNPGGNAGSQPFEESDLWIAVNRRPMTYVQGHLLNHHVHGPGAKYNLAPITRSANTQMEATFETHVKQAVLSERKVVEYIVTAEYKAHKPKREHLKEENELPTAIHFEGYEMEEDKSGKWKADTKKPLFGSGDTTIDNDLGPDRAAGIGREYINLSEATPKDLEKVDGITPDLAQAIRNLRLKREDDEPFRRYEDLEEAGVSKKLIEKLKEDKYVLLYEGG